MLRSGEVRLQRIPGTIAGVGVSGLARRVGVAGREAAVTLLERQAQRARATIGKPLGEVALDADKIYRERYGGPPVELLLVGDSIAAGLGALRPKATLGARLAKYVGNSVRRPVRLTTVAEVGAETWMVVERQLPKIPTGYRPDVAVVIVGGNDLTHRVPTADSVAALRHVIDDLRARGAAVVVGSCPDVRAVRPVPQPLRALGSRASRALAGAQARVALDAGAHVVKLADVVTPLFVRNPDELFAADRFHPSEAGYRRIAEAIVPSLLVALGHSTDLPDGHYAPT